MPTIAIEDGLAANAPHLRDLRQANIRFITGVKDGDHAFLFARLYAADEAGLTQTLTLTDSATDTVHHFRFHHNMHTDSIY